MLCTKGNTDFYVANSITTNVWNYGSPAYSGIVGIGASSPIWGNNTNPSLVQSYMVRFQNNTDWSFAQPNFTPVRTNNSLFLTQ